MAGTKLRGQVMAFINDESNLRRMEYMRQRWQDEHEYEDWGEYEGVLQEMWGELRTFDGATKRPFGFRVREESSVFHIALKVKGRYITFVATQKARRPDATNP